MRAAFRLAYPGGRDLSELGTGLTTYLGPTHRGSFGENIETIPLGMSSLAILTRFSRVVLKALLTKGEQIDVWRGIERGPTVGWAYQTTANEKPRLEFPGEIVLA
jgi:hypothetical protein